MCGLTAPPALFLLVVALCSSAARSESPASPEEAAFSLAAAVDEECSGAGDGEDACALFQLQLRGMKVAAEAHAAETHEAAATVEASAVEVAEEEEGEQVWPWSSSSSASTTNAIDAFNDQLDSSVFQAGEGLYYEFRSWNNEQIWFGSVEARPGYYANQDTEFPLASASKLWTAFAVMYTMQIRPKDWYPEKEVNLFPGWQSFCCFNVEFEVKKSNLTIHQLLTHTSGLPFSMRSSLEDIKKQTLFYKPGTQFGYTLGHRVLGWMLRDYWVAQPEGKRYGLQTIDDVYRWLIWEPLGCSKKTYFSDFMHHAFGHEGGAGDASISSTGADMAKLAVVALRRGKLPNGKMMISMQNWNKWAVPNLLPGGKLSKELVKWEGTDGSWANWNWGGGKEKIMQQSGDYGWNYFGATYFNSKEIGWCGFFSSCLRVSYENNIAMVMMQRDVSDAKKSKPYLVSHMADMAKFLQCPDMKCVRPGAKSVFCDNQGKATTWTSACPINATRGKGWGSGHEDFKVDSTHHTCYVPTCNM